MSHAVIFENAERTKEVWVGFGYGPALTKAFEDSPWSRGIPRYDPWDKSREDVGLRKLEGYKPSEALKILEGAFLRLPVSEVSPVIAKGLLQLFQELIAITKDAIRDGDSGEWWERGF